MSVCKKFDLVSLITLQLAVYNNTSKYIVQCTLYINNMCISLISTGRGLQAEYTKVTVYTDCDLLCIITCVM